MHAQVNNPFQSGRRETAVIQAGIFEDRAAFVARRADQALAGSLICPNKLVTLTWVAPFFWADLWQCGHWGGNPRGLVAGEGFERGVEDLFSGVFNAFFEIVEGHGFG